MPDRDADFPIIPEKTGLLFFDTYNAALHPRDPDRAARVAELGVIPKMERINRACREAGIAVFYAQADHRPDKRDFSPLIVDVLPGQPREKGPYRTFTTNVYAGMPEVEIIPEIAPQPEDYVIKKHRWSAFHATHLDLSLRTAGIDTIIIAGGAIEVGVGSTAYSARDLNYNQIILSDATTARTTEGWRFFMEEVFPAFARVRTVEETIALIKR